MSHEHLHNIRIYLHWKKIVSYNLVLKVASSILNVKHYIQSNFHILPSMILLPYSDLVTCQDRINIQSVYDRPDLGVNVRKSQTWCRNEQMLDLSSECDYCQCQEN